LEEIIRLRNPADRLKATLAHWLARNGQVFSVAELMRLGNPIIRYDPDFLHELEAENDYRFNATEEGCYENQWELTHRRATVAHIMARQGYQFSDEEINNLGNPMDGYNMTLRDWYLKTSKPAST
jgi:hypothetical protein